MFASVKKPFQNGFLTLFLNHVLIFFVFLHRERREAGGLTTTD